MFSFDLFFGTFMKMPFFLFSSWKMDLCLVMKILHRKSQTLYLILLEAGTGRVCKVKVGGVERYTLYHPLSDLGNEYLRIWV